MPRLDYFAPGVYIEEVNRGSRPIEGVPTAVAGFVGFTEDIRGGAAPLKPMMVTNWDQYLEYFGKPNSDGFTEFNAYLPFAVYGWFLNGGGRCYIASVGTQLPGAKGSTPTASPTQILNRRRRPTLSFSRSAGASTASEDSGGSLVQSMNGNRPPSLSVRVSDSTPKASDDSEALPSDTGEYFAIAVMDGDTVLESYEHLSMDADVDTAVGDYVVTALADSELLEVADIAQAGSPLARRPSNGYCEVSPPPFIPSPSTFSRDVEGVRDDRTGVQGLLEIDEITIMACPDLMRAYEAGLMNLDQVHGVMDLMVSNCEGAASGDIPNPPNRMVVLDPPPNRYKPQDVSNWLSEEFNRRSQFAALYYPWISVANPRDNGRPIAIPPCGHVMGVWARTDETRGVYKAPANEVPRGVLGLTYDCNFREQELLNPKGINCIRSFNNQGIRIWGARTLVEPDQTEWRYINVRRLMSYIEKSVELGTQWAVFEPNDEDLWARVTRTISNFLTNLWRQGALMGSSPSQAFYVKCDGELNTPDSMILGRLYVEVGVAPVRPAEFVIFRFSQWTGQDEG
ncbi:MAG: phage tail sheath family protein [Leptolyngbya sp. SIOISBB]|nr:phage tail sheath family protein [Leptolyngbya sp. SIOISBB]